jgi:UDP-N-acetylglucosamine 2-epimerase (hydrolysing)
VKQLEPDLIVIHGDRVEALAGSIVGSLNNILVAHVEGGEVSGTIDELIRHAVSKLSHIHFVANEDAKNRLMQLGEKPNSISVIGSPDVDIMFSDDLPTLCDAKKRYDVFFEEYAIAMLHPVTTEYGNSGSNAKCFVQSLLESKRNYIVIYPNNDLGSLEILKEFEALKNNNRFRIFPSIRFEHFLTFLKNASLIVGNSSAGVREAPYYGVPAVDIGTRQNNRVVSDLVKNVGFSVLEIVQAIEVFGSQSKYLPQENQFGGGNSAGMFIDFLLSDQFKNTSRQKEFQDLKK